MKHYDILVTVHYPKGFNDAGVRRVQKIGFIVKAENETDAKLAALNNARLAQAKHPRKYKGCTFTVAPEDCKLFTF
ncbi:MAG: hypothetical protein J6B99_09645 [Oscillospiraceae bacterium]|nr:hypothetical protein [Oscillospiraceae bacterium]